MVDQTKLLATTKFTKHATSRIEKRTRLSIKQLADILDSEQPVYVGCNKGTSRIHRLLYSGKDDEFFVAVQDRRSGDVITLLPIDYHENLAWKVSARKLKVALRKAEKKRDEKIEPPTTASIKCDPASTFLFKAYYNHSNGTLRVKRLGTLASAPYKNDISELLKDPQLFAKMIRMGERKAVDASSLSFLTVQYGKSGDPVVLTLDDFIAGETDNDS